MAAAPNGDVVAVGHNITSRGQTIAITMVRFASNGTLQWRVDLARTLPTVARLLVDASGNSYLAFNSVGDGQDIQLHKYNAAGVLLWSQVISTGTLTSEVASSLALSPDSSVVVVTGSVGGGANWITAAYNTTTGARNWLVKAAEGIAARDLVVDGTRVYVTGAGSVGTNGFLTVVAYDRATGARLWRTDANPPTGSASGSRVALAPDGSLVVTGQTSSGGYFDWWIVALSTTGAVKWQARRDAAVTGDEIPVSVLVLANGVTVVSGVGGPVTRDALGNSYMQGVTAGYGTDGTLLWEAFAKLPAVWATALPNGDVCATGGYDALVTCWRTPGAVTYQPVLTATPVSGNAPLTVSFTRSVTTDPNGPMISSVSLDYGNGPGTFNPVDLGDGTPTFSVNKTSSTTYMLPGAYTATLTVFYNNNTSVTTTLIITVNPSVIPAQPPLITASPTSGTAPLTVSFDSSAVSDPNGPLINSYLVNYGDGVVEQFILNLGNGTMSFNGTSSHTYTTAGVYTAVLTVTYNNAVSASATATVTVNPIVPPSTSTGFLSPTANGAQTSGAGDNNGYQTTPANAHANDAAVAVDTNSGTNTNTSCTNAGKDNHLFYNYNVTIPATAVIQGIQVNLDARADATNGAPKICVQPSSDGGATWTTAKSTPTLSTTETTYSLGGAADTWGRTWNSDNFSNANFRVRVIDVASNSNRDFFLDYVAVNVSYQP